MEQEDPTPEQIAEIAAKKLAKLHRVRDAANAAVPPAETAREAAVEALRVYVAAHVETLPEESRESATSTIDEFLTAAVPKLTAESRLVAAPAIGDFLRAYALENGALPLDAALTPARFMQVSAEQASGLGYTLSTVKGEDKRVIACSAIFDLLSRLSKASERHNLSWADVGITRSRDEAARYIGDIIRAGFERAEKQYPGQNPDPVGEIKSQAATPADYFERTAPEQEKNPRGYVTAQRMIEMCKEHTLTWDELDLAIEVASEPTSEGGAE